MMSCEYNFTGYYAIQVNYINANQWFSEEYSNVVGSTMNSLVGLDKFEVADEPKTSAINIQLSAYGLKEILDVNIILYYKIWIAELSKYVSVGLV